MIGRIDLWRKGMNLRELKLNKYPFERVVKHSNLEAIYKYICRDLNLKEPDSTTTYSQKMFSQILAKKTRLKFYENVWIGNRNVDFLIPCIKVEEDGYSCKGVVYEIDGSIHNIEKKIRMDNSLYEQMFKLNLLVKGILNDDLKESTVSSDLAFLLRCPRMSSRERKRLWRNIYILTIYKNMSASLISKIFGEYGGYYIQELGKLHDK